MGSQTALFEPKLSVSGFFLELFISKWHDLFADPTMADAIMDRIMYNAYILPLDSEKSMRQVMAEKIKKNLSHNEKNNKFIEIHNLLL
jgi:hypothetical protein